jgi:hypothetical protein
MYIKVLFANIQMLSDKDMCDTLLDKEMHRSRDFTDQQFIF